MNAKIKTQGAINDVLDIFQEISADSVDHDDQKMNVRQCHYHRMPSRRSRARAASFHESGKKELYNYDDYDKQKKHKQLPKISSDMTMEIGVVGKLHIHPVGHILGDHRKGNQSSSMKRMKRTRSDTWM